MERRVELLSTRVLLVVGVDVDERHGSVRRHGCREGSIPFGYGSLLNFQSLESQELRTELLKDQLVRPRLSFRCRDLRSRIRLSLQELELGRLRFLLSVDLGLQSRLDGAREL